MTALKSAVPGEIGLDEQRLLAAYRLLEEWTQGAESPLPGAALLVGRQGRVVEPRFFGRQGPEAEAPPLRPDAIFLLASITKPITCLGAMLLVERGLLCLTDPVTRYIPDFAAHHKDETRVIHLMTHTSGLPDMVANNIALRQEHAPLARFAESVIHDTVPLFQPGTSVSYQSMGTLIVARIVEQITGLTVQQFLKREIFEPLQLADSSLGVGDLDQDRIARLELPASQHGTEYHWNSPYWRSLGAPWGGMFSTPMDMAAICQTMLDGGRYAGGQLVSPATASQMTTNRLDDLPDLPERLRRTQPWGLGWRLNHPTNADSFSDLLGTSAYGHWGATGTMAWIDPSSRTFCLLFTTAPLDVHQWRLARVSNAVAAAILG